MTALYLALGTLAAALAFRWLVGWIVKRQYDKWKKLNREFCDRWKRGEQSMREE